MSRASSAGSPCGAPTPGIYNLNPLFFRRYFNYIALYRIRSAEGLAEIGGPKAKKALEEALGANDRDDVRTVVKESLEKLARQ